MARFAVVDNTGLVVNLIQLEPSSSNYELDEQYRYIRADNKGNIGDTWDNVEFHPRPVEEITPFQEDEIQQLGTITAAELQMVEQSVFGERIALLEARLNTMEVLVQDLYKMISVPLEGTRETPIDPAAEIQ